MSPNPAPVPCECGFFNKDRYHSKLGGGECSHYRSKVLMAGTSSRNPPVWEITPFLEGLGKEIEYIFDNEESFMDKFAVGKWETLIDVTFSDRYIKIVYLLDCGQHISDRISLDEYYFSWRNPCS